MEKIYDNFLDNEEMNDILNVMTSNDFPWFINPTNDYNLFETDGDENTYESFQLTHSFIRNGTKNSEFSRISTNLLNRFSEKSGVRFEHVERVKANLQTKLERREDAYNTPHIDQLMSNYKVLIYYVNDSDGDTFIFDRRMGDTKGAYRILKRITPKKGRFLLFDNEYYHSGTNPLETDSRIVINFNFL